jgi:cytochrome c-type biogenesis protein CcmE
VRVNTNADLGPVTVFGGGYNAAADIVTNDPIEVHGSSRFDTVLNRYVIQASRIDRLSGLPANLTRVTGIITGLQTTPGITAISFQLGDLAVNVTAATNGGPAGRTLANGQRVVVWGTTITGGATPTLTADALRIRDTMPSAGGKPSQVAGVASRWNAAAGTLEVNGFRVNAAGAIVVPANQSIADGSYVIVRGSFDAANVLVAEQVRIRKRLPNQGEVDLVGAIQNFVSIGNFELRGVRVDASGVNVPGNCNPANGVAVTVSGTIVNNVVVAERLRCN